MGRRPDKEQDVVAENSHVVEGYRKLRRHYRLGLAVDAAAQPPSGMTRYVKEE